MFARDSMTFNHETVNINKQETLLSHGRTHVVSPVSMCFQQLQDVPEEDTDYEGID